MRLFGKVEKASESVKNFRYLDDLIHSGVKEVVLDSDIILDDDEQSTYCDGIILHFRDLVVDGGGHTIDACGKTRIFTCSRKGITIKNVVLKNGNADSGGAIFNTGELTLTQITFKDNSAKEHGGAISNRGKLTLTGSRLQDNKARFSGGAIENRGKLTISKSTLTGNSADEGGAIFDWDGDGLTISESAIAGNSAGNGAAINNWSGTLTLSKSRIQANSANRGGVISNNIMGLLTIRKSRITANTASGDSATVNNKSGSIKIRDCEISHNNSSGNIISNNDYLEAAGCFLRDNHGVNLFTNEGEGSNLGIMYGEFAGNGVSDALVFNGGKFCIVERTVFKGNVFSDNISNLSDLTLTNPKICDGGKTIFNEGYILIKEDESDNLENKIYGDGEVDCGGSYGDGFDFGYLDRMIHESAKVEIHLDRDICFESYEKDYYEGGIELDIDNLVIDGMGHAIDGAGKSRIFMVTGENITLKNITFKNGRSHRSYDNPLNGNGGAVKVNRNADLTMENCIFTNNASEENAGAVFNTGTLTITKSRMQDNSAEKYGGAIKNTGALTVMESALRGNSAQYDGGAIFNRAELTMEESTFAGNTAEKSGGAIFNEYNGVMTIIGSMLHGNIAKDEGGAIRNLEDTLTVKDSTFTDNRAEYGGAISNFDGLLVVMKCELTDNAAEMYGGAINSTGMLKIDESILTGNTAKDGKPINNTGSMTAEDCVIEDYHSDDRGSGDYTVLG